jgi:N-acetylmuramoyl-L-alanine amidase
MRICISSGHSTKCQGAVGHLNEVEEATHVVDEVAGYLKDMGYAVEKYHDTISKTQNENLNRIVEWHNAQGNRDYDVSVHFNASETHEGQGVEVFYYNEQKLAADISAAISNVSGLKNRGAKQNKGLFFLAHTAAPAVLLEICFCDHAGDAEKYRTYFPLICEAIATILGGDELPVEPEPEDDVLFHTRGKCSYFGGSGDTTGVASDEGLAFHYAITEANQHLFVPFQPVGTSGLARRLNGKAVRYVACRFDYQVTPKEMLASDTKALVTAVKTGISQTAFCADWGPHQDTGRVADLSPALMEDLGIETDDEVIVTYPAPED